MICMHQIDFQFAPVLSYADYALGGELPAPWGGGPDWMDMYSRDFMDVQCNQYLWGYHLGNLLNFDDKSFVDDLGQADPAAAAKAQRTITASMATHGLEYFGSMTTNYRMLKKLAGGLEFIPGWAANGRWKLSDGDPDLDVAVYHNASALLVIVANYGRTRKNASVWLDFPKLIGLPGPLERRINVDFEDWNKPGPNGEAVDPANKQLSLLGTARDQQNTLFMSNTMTIPVEARDYRAFLIMNAPVAQGAGY